MDILEAIMTRRSIRKFTDEQVSDADLTTILKAGFQAPSAHNLQPWDFVIVKDRKMFSKIAQFHPYAQMLPQADICIVVCGDKSKQGMTGFMIEDCSAAIENMLLAAHGIGLGAVWCGLYPVSQLTKKMCELINLPHSIVPVGMIVLGHKGEEKNSADRFDAAKLHYEKW